jgi:signal transduction histidine kinase/ligand-binding sensor domain-containing protein/ActR/RegA family two-component response regulator
MALAPSLRAGYRSDPDFLIDTWETQQGLPDNSATSIAQDPLGYLWIGTFNGLVRFDGVSFTVYDPSTVSALPSSGIVNLHVDRSGRLWVSTLKGMAARQGNQWTTYHAEQGWTGDYARTFSENSGVVCVTSFDGKVFRVENGRIEPLPDPPGQKGRGYFGCVDASGRIWAAQDHFYGYWDGKTWVTSPLQVSVTNGFVAASQARDGTLLVLRESGLMRIGNERILSRVLMPQPVRDVWHIEQDSHGSAWLSTMDNGLFRLSDTGTLRHYSYTNGLTCDPLRCAFEDREHNIWIGTSGGGLERFKPRNFFAYDLEAGLPERNIRSVIEEEPGKFLIGTYGKGVTRLEGGRITRLPVQAGSHGPAYVVSLLQDKQHNTWAGTLSGLFILSNEVWRAVSPSESGGEKISSLFEDSSGRIWIGGNQTLCVFEHGSFTPYSTNLGLNGARFIAEHPLDHSIWVAGFEGVFQLRTNQWDELKDARNESIGDAYCLHFDPDGTLWIAGGDQGISRWRGGKWASVGEAQGLPFHAVGSLLDDGAGYWWMGSSRGVMRISRQDLEAAADGTLPRLPCQVFNESDGMPAAEMPRGYQNTGLKDSQGHLWFATLRGLATVDPEAIVINTNPAPILIEAVRLEDFSNKKSLLSNFDSTPVVVPANTREITVRFSALSFAAPEKMRFAYRIEGVDSGWKDLDDRRAIYFYPPAPGAYSLRIKAANNDGMWNETGATLAFTVQPLLWQTLWFRLLALTVLVGATGLIVWRLGRARLERKIERLEQQRTLEEERARLARVLEQSEAKLRQSQKMEAIGQLAGGVAHDFNNLLCVIRGNAELVLMNPHGLSEQATDCLRQVTAASDRAANLTRQLLAFSRKQVMQTQPLNLTGVIGNLTKMLKRIIGEDIELRCLAAERLPFVSADVGMVEQVLVNLVVNARDAMPRGGKLVISTETVLCGSDYTHQNPEAREGQFVCLSVSDNGVGIEPDNLPHIFEPFFTTKAPGQGTGLGLATVYGIIKQHQGWIEVVSKVGAGTTFKIFLAAIEMPQVNPTLKVDETKPRGGNELILVVEDDDAVRSLTRKLLEGFGYRTVEAVSGRQALEQWSDRTSEIDLLMTDMVMPEGLTGRDLAEQMRARRPDLKVLFMSGYSPEVAGKDTEFIQRNGAHFLQKPVPPRELLRTVRHCLDTN